MAAGWFYTKDGSEKFGPFTGDEFKRLVVAGTLQPQDKVWQEGKRKWVEARKVEKLFDPVGVDSASRSSQSTLAAVETSEGGVAIMTQPSVPGKAKETGPSQPPKASPPPAAKSPPASAASIALPIAAQMEKSWLSWRAAQGQKGPSLSKALDFVAKQNDRLELSEQLSAVNEKVAVGSNQLLAEIAKSLVQLGFTLEGAAERLARAEKLHADHSESVKRERALKELLGQISKYQEMIGSLYDEFSRAYGSKLLLETITRHRFSVRELPDLADKTLYDSQIARASETLRKLPREAHADIENFEKTYATYHWLLGSNPEPELQKLKKELPKTAKTTIEAPIVPPKGLQSFWVLFFLTVAWWALLLLASVGKEPPMGGYAAFLGIAGGPPILVTFIAFIIPYLKFRRLMKKYTSDRQEYVRQRAVASKEVKTLQEQVQAHNDVINKMLPAVRQDHQNALATLKQVINDFLVAHPQLPTFVNRIG